MNKTAKTYVDLFRSVKVASAATVDAQGRPQSRIINIMIALDEGMVIVTSRGKPFWKQLMDTGEIAATVRPTMAYRSVWKKCLRCVRLSEWSAHRHTARFSCKY